MSRDRAPDRPGADVDAGLIGQQPKVGEGSVHRAGHHQPPLPAGQQFPVPLPGGHGASQEFPVPWGGHGASASRGVVGLLAQEQEWPGQAVVRDRGDRGAVHVDARADAGIGQHGRDGGGAAGGVAGHRYPGRVDQPGGWPRRVRTGQLAEHEGHIRCPACRYLLLGPAAPPACLAGQAGGDPPVGKGRGEALVGVINPGHDVTVAGQVLGQGGERAAGAREAGREHDQGQAALLPGRRGVADRVGLNRAQRVRRDASDAPACELEFRLRCRHVRGWPPLRRRRRVPQGDHQLSGDRSRGPGIGTGGVCQPQGRGAGRARAGRLRQAQRGPLPGRRAGRVCGRSHAAHHHRPPLRSPNSQASVH